MPVQPTVGETLRKKCAHFSPQGSDISWGLGIVKCRCDISAGRKINENWQRLLPVGRDLQDRWTTQAAMREEHLFPEALPIERRHYIGGNSGEVAVVGPVFRNQHEGHETWPGLADRESKLPREIIAEGSRSHFWNRETAGGNHQHRGMKLSLRGACDETGGVPNLLDGCAQENVHPSISAFCFEHA